MSVLGICLVLAATQAGGNAPVVFVPVPHFTLAWTHSIEKVRWEEDYAVVERLEPTQAPAQPPLLRALAARVRGSAAGMEPPEDAQLRNGWYEYTPQLRTPLELRLTRSEFTPDYDLCTDNHCRPLADWLASDGGVTQLTPCRQPARR